MGYVVPSRLSTPRIQTPEEAQAICSRMWIDDQIGSINRGRLKGMVDGEPPYLRDDLRRNGQMYRCNINWHSARSAVNNARALYVDLLNSVAQFIALEFPGDIDPTNGNEWGIIIAEEFTRTLRNWREFQFQVDRLVDQFIGYGAGFAYNESPRDWRWISAGLGDVLFPRSTKANEEYVDIVMMRRPYFLYELAEKITDPDIAQAAGWNVDEVKAAMKKAQGNDPRLGNDWETQEKELFEATYYYAYGSKNEMVWCDHLYVRETGGSYTHQIVLTEKGGGFLYEKISEFENASDFFTIFTNGGGNGDIHGQRGMLFDIFPQTQAINQIQCQMVDNLRLSMSMMLQASSEEALQDLAMIDFGPFKILPPKVNIQEVNLSPPNADALNVLTYLSNQQASNTGQYSALTAGNAILQAPTAQQGRMATANDNTLSQSQTNLFYTSWTHLLRRIYKRLTLPDWQAGEPGGEEALEFQKRCYIRGVPKPTPKLDVLRSPIDVQAVRAVGYGSPANRIQIQMQLMQLAGQMSPVAQNELMRNIAASLGNGRMADIYFPRTTTLPSQVEDEKIAEMENSLMRLGQQQSVFGNNLVHATTHTAAIVQLMQEALQGQVQPQAILTFLQPAIQHTQQHVQLLAKDQINQQKAAQFGPILLQANAMMQKAMSIQQKNAAQSAQLGQEQQQIQGQEDPLQQARVADIQSKIQERDQRMQLEAAKLKTEMDSKRQTGAHKDAALAHKIQVDNSKEMSLTK